MPDFANDEHIQRGVQYLSHRSGDDDAAPSDTQDSGIGLGMQNARELYARSTAIEKRERGFFAWVFHRIGFLARPATHRSQRVIPFRG
jgi:hypothetical protein